MADTRWEDLDRLITVLNRLEGDWTEELARAEQELEALELEDAPWRP